MAAVAAVYYTVNVYTAIKLQYLINRQNNVDQPNIHMATVAIDNDCASWIPIISLFYMFLFVFCTTCILLSRDPVLAFLRSLIDHV